MTTTCVLYAAGEIQFRWHPIRSQLYVLYVRQFLRGDRCREGRRPCACLARKQRAASRRARNSVKRAADRDCLIKYCQCFSAPRYISPCQVNLSNRVLCCVVFYIRSRHSNEIQYSGIRTGFSLIRIYEEKPHRVFYHKFNSWQCCINTNFQQPITHAKCTRTGLIKSYKSKETFFLLFQFYVFTCSLFWPIIAINVSPE